MLFRTLLLLIFISLSYSLHIQKPYKAWGYTHISSDSRGAIPIMTVFDFKNNRLRHTLPGPSSSALHLNMNVYMTSESFYIVLNDKDTSFCSKLSLDKTKELTGKDNINYYDMLTNVDGDDKVTVKIHSTDGYISNLDINLDKIKSMKVVYYDAYQLDDTEIDKHFKLPEKCEIYA